jgi:3-oxoacyl-[acyl-carrier-protein] synthase-3
MLFGNITIESIVYELGPHRVTNADIEDQLAEPMARLGISPGYLEKLTSIRERRFWDNGVQPSQAASKVARQLIDQSGIDQDEIGCLVNTSVCRDYIEPSTASLVHGNLKLSPHCLNFDIGNACVGFLHGMQTIAMMLNAGAIKYGLVVCAEGSRDGIEATIQRLQAPDSTVETFKKNFATFTIGSGAVAMLLAHKDNSRTGHTINGMVNLAATEHNRLCVASKDEMLTDATNLLVEGIALAGRTWHVAAGTLDNWSDETIDRYVPHQVSLRQISGMVRTMGITRDKIQLNVQTQGNMAAAALPITLGQAAEEGTIQGGNHVGLLGIGSGLNCSMMSLSW